MLKDLIQPPAWFKTENREQEDVVAAQSRKWDENERMQAERIALAKASAMPKAVEYVRELESRSKNQYGGTCAPWTPEAWKRVMQSPLSPSPPISCQTK